MTYDDVQNVVRRSRKKVPPPAPPAAKKPVLIPVLTPGEEPEVNYDDVVNLRQQPKSSVSSTSSSEAQRRKDYLENDRETARKSFQEAPEHYR